MKKALSKQQTRPDAIAQRMLRVPYFNDPLSGYCGCHVDVQLDVVQADALKRTWLALDRSGARLANGRPIASRGDVLRFVLENLHEPQQDE